MKYLLDTHTFIWALSDLKKLPALVRSIIDDRENTIFVSSITFWEIAIKVRRGRLSPIGLPNETTVEAAESMGFLPIPLLPEEAASSKELTEDTHFDPFDRMLVWQAIKRNLTLISRDTEFSKFAPDGLKILWK